MNPSITPRSPARPAETAATERLIRFASAPPAAAEGRVLLENLDIRIDRDGLWYYHGSVITRKELVCLYASVLTRDDTGGYWLVTPREMGRIDVEDVPFIAVEMFVAGHGRDQVLSFRTNVDEIVTADRSCPLTVTVDPQTGEPAPYLRVCRQLDARLSRPVFYDLVNLGEEATDGDVRRLGVWSSGVWFPLGDLGGE